MTKKEAESNINLEIIREIAFTKIDGVEEHDNHLVELLLRELYYYSKEDKKVINVKTSVTGLYDFLDVLISASSRMTDLWDSLYVIYTSSANTDSLYEKTHKQLYTELGGHRKRMADLDKLFQNANMKLSKYYMSLD